jgi:hypothetical protein
MIEAEEKMAKEEIESGRHVGWEGWVRRMFGTLGLEHALRPRERPAGRRKKPKIREASC